MAAALLGAACGLALQKVQAQQIETLTPQQAEQERARRQMGEKGEKGEQREVYEDKFMDPLEVGEQDASSDYVGPLVGDGWGLSTFGLESRYGYSSYESSGSGTGPGGARQRSSAGEWGQQLHFSQQTLNHGEWNLQAEGRLRQGDERLSSGPLGFGVRRSGQRVVLRNLAFPVGGGIFADSATGDQYADVTDALRRNYRLFLGSSVIRGAATRIYGRDFDVSAGMGERGRLVGGPFAGFENFGGTLAWLGATRRFASGYFAGLQVNQARNVLNPWDMIGADASPRHRAGLREDVLSSAAAFGFGKEPVRDGDFRWRLTWLHSRADAQSSQRSKTADGAFVEVTARLAGLRHEWGLYRTDPQLRFGDNLILSDNRGAYWRMDGNAARLSWGLGLDAAQQNQGRNAGSHGSRQWGLFGNAQYRINRHDSLGLSGHWSQQRRFNLPPAEQAGGQRSVQANAFYQTRFADWAPTRLRMNIWRNEALVANDARATGEELQWEQDWIQGRYETMRPELTTTLGWARERNRLNDQTYPTAGLIGRYWINPGWSVGGALRYTSRSSNLFTSRGLSGSVNSEAELGGGWRMGASLQLNQARTHMQVSGMAGPSGASMVTRSNDRSVYVYLRWEGSAGQPLRALGQGDSSGAGSGAVRGVVFMDANNDGERQPMESGAAQVEVILDGRYRTLTDSSGQFEFPMVVTGSHQLSLRAESVPLPWGPVPGGSASIEVPLRGVANAHLPVIRVGGSE